MAFYISFSLQRLLKKENNESFDCYNNNKKNVIKQANFSEKKSFNFIFNLFDFFLFAYSLSVGFYSLKKTTYF